MNSWTTEAPVAPGYYWAVLDRDILLVKVHEMGPLGAGAQLAVWPVDWIDDGWPDQDDPKIADFQAWAGPVLPPDTPIPGPLSGTARRMF